MDWLDYRKKLGIGFDDQEKVENFMNKIFNILEFDLRSAKSQISLIEYFNFCNISGIKMEQGNLFQKGYHLIVQQLHMHSESLEDFLSYYMVFINCQTDGENKKVTREAYKKVLCNILKQSHILYDVVEDDDGYFVFPQGAKELDDALVSQPLEWLEEYPNARKTYVTALKQYMDGIYIRDVADNLRKTLEGFLQEFLGNKKNLETNKNEICKYLGTQNVDPAISGLFQPLIIAYKNINDRNIKHNDNIDEKLLEFLLYQTGILIRMVLVVKKSE